MEKDFLKNARKKAGLKQKDVSKKLGISSAAYCNIEKGNRKPSVNLAKAIAAMFGFEWTAFYE